LSRQIGALTHLTGTHMIGLIDHKDLSPSPIINMIIGCISPKGNVSE